MHDVFRPRSILLSSFAFLLLGAPGTTAQTAGATTGAIEGTVTDTSGAVLPGVTVTAAGDALMALRTTVSATDGTYRMSGLPPGIYRV
jgi:hypothetical protein